MPDAADVLSLLTARAAVPLADVLAALGGDEAPLAGAVDAGLVDSWEGEDGSTLLTLSPLAAGRLGLKLSWSGLEWVEDDGELNRPRREHVRIGPGVTLFPESDLGGPPGMAGVAEPLRGEDDGEGDDGEPCDPAAREPWQHLAAAEDVGEALAELADAAASGDAPRRDSAARTLALAVRGAGADGTLLVLGFRPAWGHLAAVVTLDGGDRLCLGCGGVRGRGGETAAPGVRPAEVCESCDEAGWPRRLDVLAEVARHRAGWLAARGNALDGRHGAPYGGDADVRQAKDEARARVLAKERARAEKRKAREKAKAERAKGRRKAG